MNNFVQRLTQLWQDKRVRRGVFIAIPLIVLIVVLTAPDALNRQGTSPNFTTNTGETRKPTFFTSKEDEVDEFVPVNANNEQTNTFAGELASEGIYETETPPEPTAAISAKEKLLPDLPIYIENFETSVGTTTIINVFTVSGDRNDTIRLEIYGIDFQDTEVREDLNPDVTAFKESFLEAKKRIESHGVLMSDLNFIFGTREHIQYTANYWVKTLGLL